MEWWGWGGSGWCVCIKNCERGSECNEKAYHQSSKASDMLNRVALAFADKMGIP